MNCTFCQVKLYRQKLKFENLHQLIFKSLFVRLSFYGQKLRLSGMFFPKFSVFP